MKRIYILTTFGAILLAIAACGSLESLLSDSSDTRFIRISSLGETVPADVPMSLTVSWSFGEENANKDLDEITWSVSNASVATIKQDASTKSIAELTAVSAGDIVVSVTVASLATNETLTASRSYMVTGPSINTSSDINKGEVFAPESDSAEHDDGISDEMLKIVVLDGVNADVNVDELSELNASAASAMDANRTHNCILASYGNNNQATVVASVIEGSRGAFLVSSNWGTALDTAVGEDPLRVSKDSTNNTATLTLNPSQDDVGEYLDVTAYLYYDGSLYYTERSFMVVSSMAECAE